MTHVDDIQKYEKTEIKMCPACRAPYKRIEEVNSCPDCKTLVWHSRFDFEYDNQYPNERNHHNLNIDQVKERTIEAWLSRSQCEVKGKKILEVGFGGAAVLAKLKSMGAIAFGQEVVDANISMAKKRGINENHLSKDILDFAHESERFSGVIYCDSFEHIKKPSEHFSKLDQVTETGSWALVVTPRSDCLSRYILGSLWPHDLKDHWVIYSYLGLQKLWSHYGWEVEKSFFPIKYINIDMAFRHLELKLPIKLPQLSDSTIIPFNFGEMGLLFRKKN